MISLSRSRRIRLPLVVAMLCGLLGICFSAGARAADESQAAAIGQSDGIVNRVVDGLWSDTDYYWHHGDYNRIIALDRICVSADPSFVEAYGTASWLLWSQGDLAASDRLMQDGITRSPARAAISYEFGEHLFTTKRFPEAAKYLKLAIHFGDEARLAYTMLAHSYRYLGRYDDSIAEWKVIVKKFPDFPAAQRNLERVEALKHGKKESPTVPQTRVPSGVS